MAYTEAQKAAIEKAIASGVTRVSYDGKTVEYRSLQEMREVLNEINKSLSTTTVRHIKPYASKGL